MAETKVMQGARGSVKLDGVKVAYVGGVSVSITNETTEIPVLDQLELAEIPITGHKASFTVRHFKIDENAPSNIGLETDNLDDLLSAATKTFELYDRVADKVRCSISGVVFLGGDGELDPRGVWNGTWNFAGTIGKWK